MRPPAVGSSTTIPVHLAAALPGEISSARRVARHDQHESRPRQHRRRRSVPVLPGIELQQVGRIRGRARDLEPEQRGLMLQQLVDGGGNLARDARAHQHVIHSREHRAVEQWEVGALDLGEQVDAHQAVEPLPGEVDLHEGREDGKDFVSPRPSTVSAAQRQQAVHRAGCAAAGPEVLREHFIGHARHRKGRHGAADVAVRVAVLQVPDEHGIDRGTRHHAQVAQPRYGTWARRQSDTAMPMPPWMIRGSVPRFHAGYMADTA